MQHIFNQAAACRTLEALEEVIEIYPNIKNGIEEFKQKYPAIDLNQSPEELSRLISEGKITNELMINMSGAVQYTPFEKLLLAVLWKNGQMSRVQPILQGMLQKNAENSNFGEVFRQFGKSLVDPTEPIIDQHVLRAFSIYGPLSADTKRKDIIRGYVFKRSDRDLILDYVRWFQSTLNLVSPTERQAFKHLLDKVLFVIGKQLGL